MEATLKRIIVCGGGLAAHMTAAALARHFFDTVQVTLVRCDTNPDTDAWYGSTTAPSAYAFNLAIGVSEPQLMVNTTTTFSWGTRYVSWGADARSWVQCFHLPLPVVDGVMFHHYLARLGIHDLQPYLPSAAAALRGVFAHPTQRAGPPLTRAEYGYQIDAASYQAPFAAVATASRIAVLDSSIVDVERADGGITSIRLADGGSVAGDLFVDCTGPAGRLISRLDGAFEGGRRLRGTTSFRGHDGVGPPHRSVTACDSGWYADTSLQGGTSRLSVESGDAPRRDPEPVGSAEPRISEVTLGRRTAAWAGNCVAIGQAACVLEPVTLAPMVLLQRDIERLLALVPWNADMSVERREFNRQAEEDQTHAALFNRALLGTQPAGDSAYWREAAAEPLHEKLARKIAAFESQGALVAYDLEPFAAEDWTILHFGLGRRSARYDRVADRAAEPQVREYLSRLSGDVARVVASMPSHADYLAGLKRYLMKQGR